MARTRLVMVRVDEEDYASIDAARGRATFAGFVREAALAKARRVLRRLTSVAPARNGEGAAIDRPVDSTERIPLK